MNDTQLAAALRRTLADAASRVPVPDPPVESDLSVPAGRGPRRGAGVILAAASVLLVIGVGIVVTGLADNNPAPPAAPEPSPTATGPAQPVPPPRVLVVDGDTLRYGDVAIDTGLPTPLVGSAGPSTAVIADADGIVWQWNFRDPAATLAAIGSDAVSTPQVRPGGNESTWLSDTPDGVAVVTDTGSGDLMTLLLPPALQQVEPGDLVLGEDMMARTFVGAGSQVWMVDRWEDWTDSAEFGVVEGIAGEFLGVFDQGILVRGEDGSLAWGYVTPGSGPRYQATGSVPDAETVMFASKAAWIVTNAGELQRLVTRMATLVVDGQHVPIPEPTGEAVAVTMPDDVTVTDVVAARGGAVVASGRDGDDRMRLYVCRAGPASCEVVRQLSGGARLLP